MKLRRITPAGVVFAALILLVLAALLRLGTHQTARVTLPDELGLEDPDPTANDEQDEIRRVEVTRDTVQRAVATLARPANYTQQIRIERFFFDESGLEETTLRAADGWARLDPVEDDGDARHVIVGGDGVSRIWYGEDDAWYSGAAAFSTDEELRIPTYEDVLALETARIGAADYRPLGEKTCIYIETLPDQEGYAERWWVSVESGLLAAAEQEQNGTLIYRMTETSLALDTVDASAFTLPDGTVLFDPQKGEAPEETEA